MRVQVYIPGTVESYCIDERGDKRVATDDLWLETYLCSVLRAYSYADDGSGDTIKKIVGVRRFNPITSTESEHKFLDAAERLFFNGWQLGSDPEIQVPNLVSNHLTTGLLNYIHTTGRYASGINLFEKLRTKDPEISSLLARVYIEADEEVKAVQLLHEAIQDLPMDYSLLDCQAEFCNRKGRGDLALEIAKRSVVSAPSEFGTWARLAEIYVSLEQWDLALLTLNSCPMFTYQDKDAPRMPEPQRVFLPIMPEAICDEIIDNQVDDVELVHPTLRKLHAAGFKGTFLKAYMLLTEVTKKIGWDQLLKIRSQVFVMEEEYRNEKQTAPHGQTTSRNASVTALRSPSPTPKTNGEAHGQVEETPSDAEDDASNGEPSSSAALTLEKPPHTVASEVVKAGSEDPHPPATPSNPNQQNYTHFHNKRLCERWLDNLFMVLYEDLRVYTIWRTEMAQYRSQQLLYKKSPEEWEILGELAERLHHEEEAVDAYENCLQMKFSPKAMRGVLKLEDGSGANVRDVCGALIRLVTWQYRWYSEVCLPRCFVKEGHVLTKGTSSRRTCCTPSASSSRKRAPSRLGVSSRERACRSMCWILRISMQRCVLLSGAVGAMAEQYLMRWRRALRLTNVAAGLERPCARSLIERSVGFGLLKGYPGICLVGYKERDNSVEDSCVRRPCE
jgi:tetratricopeptide (TPR) repeat protein